jgi:hypothetical protein
MNRLTIIQKPQTTRVDTDTPLWEYEVLETGEIFASFSDDIASSFSCFVQQQQVEDDVIANLPVDECIQQSSAEPTFNECVPENKPEITPRQEAIENMLIDAYAYNVINIVVDFVNENCEGCKIDDPSQWHHDCIMLDNDISVYRYLTEALEKVNDEKVMEAFTKLTEILDPPLNGLERLKYECKDSRQEIVSRKRDDLESLSIQKLDLVGRAY